MINKIVDMYQSENGYKAISKALGIQRTTVRALSTNGENLELGEPSQEWPGPTKMTPRAQWQLI